MYRLNLVAMVVLSVAVAGTGAFLALQNSSVPEAVVDGPKLLRRLADGDPDVRREAETELRNLGPRATDILREAKNCKDVQLAARARRLLGEIEGTVVAMAAPEKGSEGACDTAVVVPIPGQEVEVFLVVQNPRVTADRPPRFYVRLTNRGVHPVLVLRDQAGGRVTYARFADFEIQDDAGRTVSLPSDAAMTVSEAEEVWVEPGETLDLYAGQTDAVTSFTGPMAPGSYRVRFVYDASENSEYRASLAKVSRNGIPLPPRLLISNEVTLTVE